jgi:hypothetical protein
VQFKDGKVSKIRLIPVDLEFQKPFHIRGRPKYANKVLGKKITRKIIEQSRMNGTKIEYLESGNLGEVK